MKLLVRIENMKVLIFFTFVLTIIHTTNTASVVPSKNSARQNTTQLDNTFLISINKICPQLASNKILMDPKQLQECKDWDRISITSDLKDDSEQNILCLLYYDSFISFCEEMKKYNITMGSNSNFNVTPIDTVTICEEGLFPADRLYKHVMREKINKKVICYKLCTSYDDNEPVYECTMAHYFANFNFSSLAKVNNASFDSVSQKKIFNIEASSINMLMENNKSKNDTQSGKHQESNQTQVPVAHAIVAQFQKDEETLAQQQSNVQPLQSLPQKPQESSTDSQVTKNTNSKPIDHLAESQAQKTPEKNKKEAKGDAKMNANPDQIQNNTAVKQEHISNNKQDDHDSGSSQNPKKADNPQQIQKGDAILKDNPMAQEEAEGNTKVENPKNADNLQQIQKGDAILKDNPMAQEEAEGNTKVENPKNADNPQQIQKGDAILKDNPMAQEEAEGNTKLDNVEEENSFEEAAAENADAGLDGEPVLPLAVEIPQQQDQDKPPQQEQDERPMLRGDGAEEIDGDSYFFSYFMVICVVFILGYVGYHNRLKVMALVLEGKRNKRQYRGRRPNSANYHKLDSNLEEAISSNVTKNSSNVIY